MLLAFEASIARGVTLIKSVFTVAFFYVTPQLIPLDHHLVAEGALDRVVAGFLEGQIAAFPAFTQLVYLPG